MPRPWTRRTSQKPFAAAAATYSVTTAAVSSGRNGVEVERVLDRERERAPSGPVVGVDIVLRV